MSFVSKIHPNEFIIDESNSHLYAPNQDVKIKNIKTGEWEPKKRGLILPDYEERQRQRSQAVGRMAAWTKPVYSREVLREKIKEREQRGTLLSNLIKQKNIPTSDQNSTNYCWTYGFVSAIVCQRVWRNLPYVEYSRESVAATIKGGSNSGGWGIQALNYVAKYGIMPQNLWPKWSRNVSQYNTAANLAIGLQHKVDEFIVLEDENFLQMMTALVEDHSVAVGYNWWRHEVCAVDPVIIGSTDLGIRIWNSWGNGYGDRGFAILSESKATADDAVIPVVQSIAA